MQYRGKGNEFPVIVLVKQTVELNNPYVTLDGCLAVTIT